MMAKTTEANTMSTNSERVKKSQEKTDAIMLRPKLEEGQIIRDTAKAVGKNLSAYILDATRIQMKKDKAALREYMENHKEDEP